jgi:thymidylate synthase (FAD)
MSKDILVEKVWITPEAEKLIAKIARVSNPNNQDNPNYAGLVKYLINNQHWSPLEMASMCLSINTSRRIAPQILRHRSFSFQEFSTRYAAVDGFVEVNPRSQDLKNRQSSHDDLSEETKTWFQENKTKLESQAMAFYKEGLDKGIAKETMAFMLPMSAKTHIYMTGTIRSWIHYVDLRADEATQLEHRIIAQEAKKIIIQDLPIIAEAMNWTN